MHPCERCGAPILEKYRVCYLCMRDMQQDADASHQVPKVEYASPTVSSLALAPPDARQSAIAKAHDDNMTANRELVAAIIYLADTIKEGRKCA